MTHEASPERTISTPGVAGGETVTLRLAEARLHGVWACGAVADRPSVVFLHDGLGCTESLREWPLRVGRALRLGAFSYDRWGYGRSDRRAEFPYQFMEDEAERLPRVLEAAGINDYCLVAHSDGATIALLHAATRPVGLRAVVSVAAHVTLDPMTLGEIQRLQQRHELNRIPEFLRRFHGDRAAHVLECWTSLARNPAYRHWDIRPRIAAIRCPLLAVQGEHDAFGMPEQLSGIAQAVPHAEVRLLPGMGHFPHVDDLGVMTDLVAAFLARYIDEKD